VIVEKRARDKAAADEIDIRSEQNADHIVVEVKARKNDSSRDELRLEPVAFGEVDRLDARVGRSRRESGDGSIDVERSRGRVEMRSRRRQYPCPRRSARRGDCAQGDGSIRIDGVNGAINRRTGGRQHRAGRQTERGPGASR